MGFHIDSAVDEGHAFFPEQQDLLVDAAEGEGGGRLAVAVHDAEARDSFRVGVDVQGVAHHTAPAGIAREGGDLSVGRDLAVGDAPDDIIDQFKGVFHMAPYFKTI